MFKHVAAVKAVMLSETCLRQAAHVARKKRRDALLCANFPPTPKSLEMFFDRYFVPSQVTSRFDLFCRTPLQQ